MDDKTRVYLINVVLTLLAILGVPLFYFVFVGHLSVEELIISLMFTVPLALVGLFYGLRYMKKNFGPEWYRMKDNIPPKVGKSLRVRVFEGAGMLIFLLGVVYGILIRSREVILLLGATGYVIAYQGFRERVKHLPPEARKIYERGYKIIFFIWLSFLLGLIIWLISSILPLRL